MNDRPTNVFTRLTPGGLRNFADDLRAENAGAVLLLAGTVLALVWANSPWRDATRPSARPSSAPRACTWT
jgi:NhaA family Na+:H+ antiporter